MPKHITRTCLWSVTLKVEYCTDLDAYISKKQSLCKCKMLL